MGYEERKRAIMSELEFCGRMTFHDVERIVDVAPTTIRRDLARMSEEGLLTRFHGGVRMGGSSGVSEYSMRQKQAMHASAKERIAAEAVRHIGPNELVFLGGGSTTYCMIEQLAITSISVITNSIPHAEALHKRGVRTFLLCGFLRERTRSLGGNETVSLMRKYRFDRCFVGANGMGFDLSLLSADSLEHEIKETALELSNESYVLVDASKFGTTAMYSIPVDSYKNVRVITDRAECVGNPQAIVVEGVGDGLVLTDDISRGTTRKADA